MSYKSKYRLFKIVKAGQRHKEVSLLPYGFKNLGLASSHASLEFSSNNKTCLDVIVKDDKGNVMFRANAHSNGILQSYADKKR